MDSVKVVGMELTNFKSFSHLLLDDLQKSTLYAIVGFNGTGKSNIIDAFLYVLGEKRCQILRVRRLADIISSNPSGDSNNRCTVSLTVERNSERMSIERSTTNDGVCSYKVNGEMISYADYLERLKVLTINTAVQNYFILQGNIQDVACMSDKHMTIFLERISGSIEFKKEHERYLKLQAEAQERMMQKRIAKNSFRKSVRDAGNQIDEYNQFLDLEKEKENLEINKGLFVIYQITEQINELDRQVPKRQGDIDEAEKAKVRIEQEIENQPALIEDNHMLINETEMQIANAELELQKINAELSRLQQEFVNQTASSLAYEKDYQHHFKRQEICMENRLMYENNMKRIDGLMQTLRAYLDQMIVPTEEQIAEYYENKQIVDCRKALERTTSQGFLQMKQRHLNTQIEVRKGKIERIQDHLEPLANDSKMIREKCAKLQTSIDEQIALEQSFGEPPNKLGDIKRRICNQKMELSQLTETISKMEDYLFRQAQLPENIEELQSNVENVIGRLREFMDTKPGKAAFQSAIYVKLYEHLNAILVDSLETAERCKQFLYCKSSELKENYLIVPTEPVDRNTLHANIPQSELLSNILEQDAAVRVVVDQKQDAVLMENAASARAVSSDMGTRVSAVSKNVCYDEDGTVTWHRRPKGLKQCTKDEFNALMKTFDSLMEKIMDEYKKINECDDYMSDFTKRMKAKRSLMDDQASLEVYKKELERIDIELEPIRTELTKNESMLAELQQKLEECQVDVDNDFEQKIEDELFATFCTKHGFDNIRHFEEVAFHNTKEKQQRHLQTLCSQYNDFKNLFHSTNEEMDQRRSTLDVCEVNRKDFKKKQEHIEEDMRFLKGKQTFQQNQLKTLMDNRSSQEKPAKDVDENLLNLRRHLAFNDTKLEALKTDLMNIKGELDKLHETRKFYRQQFRNKQIVLPMREELSDASSVSSFDYDFESLPLALRRSFLRDAYDSKIAEFDAKIRETQAQMTQLGKLNPNAEQERAVFQQDYLRAMGEFHETVEQVNNINNEVTRLQTQRTERLNACLQHLENAVDRIYKDLMMSNAACAQILPMDKECPYASGISYMCAVPGKAFNRIRELSTGQKSMAALALYFALREYSPAPLFLLDEIDARLDSANLHKLGEFLDNHRAAGLQTFVVTHHAEVAAHADELLTVVESSLESLEKKLARFDLTDYAF